MRNLPRYPSVSESFVMTSYFTIVALVLTFGATAFGQHGVDKASAVTVRVTLTYTGLDALPWGSKVHIYVKDLSRQRRALTPYIANTIFATTGQQIPITTSLHISRSSLHENHVYALCAEITVLGRQRFACERALIFSPHRLPRAVTVVLQRRY